MLLLIFKIYMETQNPSTEVKGSHKTLSYLMPYRHCFRE